jgi:hypothetical protein
VLGTATLGTAALGTAALGTGRACERKVFEALYGDAE